MSNKDNPYSVFAFIITIGGLLFAIFRFTSVIGNFHNFITIKLAPGSPMAKVNFYIILILCATIFYILTIFFKARRHRDKQHAEVLKTIDDQIDKSLVNVILSFNKSIDKTAARVEKLELKIDNNFSDVIDKLVNIANKG